MSDHDQPVSPGADPAPAQHHDLGIAGRTAKTFINSPVTPMLLIATLMIGILALLLTPRQEDPQISVPMIDIFVQYPGAAAPQVSSLVTEPLERLISELPGVEHVYSATERGQAMVTVQFEVGEPMGPSIVKVHDKLQSNMDKMPPGVQPPMVKPVSVDDVPVVTLTLWSEDVDDGALRALANDILQRLGEVPNAGKGFIVGGRAEQIHVEVMPERLSGFGISLEQIAQTIKTANAERSAGDIETGGTSFNVYTGSFLRNADEVGRLVVATRDGSPIYVRDVAKVYQGPAEPSQIVNYFSGPALAEDQPQANGQGGVTIAIAKKEGSNGVSVAENILEKLETLKGVLIPSNVHVLITRDYGKTANDKVNELLLSLFEAAVAVSILCWIGLGARAAFVVITVIPVVILITVWAAWVMGYTIDRVSLFALVFSIGILVDDAAVVVENMFRRWLEEGRTSVETGIDAVREVGNPTILATFTIIAALMPMGFVSGMMGPYMLPIPVLGSAAMFFSLIAAFIFTPWTAMRVRPRMAALEKAERREHKTREYVHRVYRPVISRLIENRKLGIFFLVGIIGLTAATTLLFYTQAVPVKMLPFDNKPEFSVIVNMPEGTALPVTANVAHRLAEEVRKLPEVTGVVSYAGTAQPMNFNGMVRHYYLRQRPWHGDLLVMLQSKHDRERGSHEIAEAARELLTPVAASLGAKIQVVEMPPGPPVLQTYATEIYGPTAEIRRQLAQDMTQIFERVPNIVDEDNYIADPYQYWRFDVDTEKAVRRGISVDSINETLAMAMGGYRLGDIKRGSVLEPTYIVMEVPLSTRSNILNLSDLPIRASDGGTVPLSELGQFVQAWEDPVIYHKDLRPVEYVVGEGVGGLGAPVYGMFATEDILEGEYTAPDGVKIEGMPWGLIGPPDSDAQSGFEWTGEWTVTYETFRDMGMAFMAAMVLIYGLIVWEFRNFALAGLIMAPIPLTMIGILPGHWIMGADFTATSMIGLIALGGIIVRQSILIVEFVKIEVAKGRNVTEAAVIGTETRMRPILITSLALMVGSWAIINDPIFQGMAVSLLFGAAAGTLFALLVIPLGCISARKQFYLEQTADGDMRISPRYAELEKLPMPGTRKAATAGGTPIWFRLWSGIMTVFTWAFYLVRAVFLMLGQLFAKKSRPTAPPPASTPPSGSAPGGGGGPSGGGPGGVTPPMGGGGQPVPSQAAPVVAQSHMPAVYEPAPPVIPAAAVHPVATPARAASPAAAPAAEPVAEQQRRASERRRAAGGGKQASDDTGQETPAASKKRRGIRLRGPEQT